MKGASGAPAVVGIGASAGGLEAFTRLLKQLPTATGFAFVLVQHLDPTHESALTTLLSRATKMPVQEVTHKLQVAPDHIYIIPPNQTMTIVKGMLQLETRRGDGAHHSIDRFFESLALDCRERAVGVVLSGTANDGTLGLEAIKAEGGITFAQDETAKYDTMPRTAIAAGCVDLVLSPEGIAKEIERIARHPYVRQSDTIIGAEEDRAEATAHEDDATPLPSGGRARSSGGKVARAEAERGEAVGSKATESGFRKILLLLRNRSGVDFSLYKSSTIRRRIGRRMVLSKHETTESYAAFLRGNNKELDALYSDVLIGVTGFFRNPEAFEVIERKILPKLIQQRTDEALRVWVLGCSTGQEAYSLAMLFVEAAEKSPRMRKLQIFATDLNEGLLEKARSGLYAKSLVQDISPERLRRFFVEDNGGYRVVKLLREMVVFARQNVIGDPPFSRMDVVSCRNLLIYLDPEIQQKALPTFHYALKPGGVLFLGASESVGRFTDLFEAFDKKHKIFVKKPVPSPALHLPLRSHTGTVLAQDRPPAVAREKGEPKGLRGDNNTAQREADRVTLDRFAPPAVLVDSELRVLQFRGDTSAFLEPPKGKAEFNVLKMARDSLAPTLRAAINQAKKDLKVTHSDKVRLQRAKRTVSVTVAPLKNLREQTFLILFHGADTAMSAPKGKERGRPMKAQARKGRVSELERELSEINDYLQAVQEQYDAANEELQAANEEAQSSNEELQSVNEELETSKEELESANEELTTVNEEMVNRNAALARLNADLVNLQGSTRLVMLMVGRDLGLRYFSPRAEREFSLLATDIGRPIASIRHNLVVADLHRILAEVIDTVREQEHEVRDSQGHWCSLRVRPYMTADNRVDGAVVVLVDIDALKRSEIVISSTRDAAQNVIDTVQDPLIVLDKNLRVESANRAFYRMFRVTPAASVGRFVYELGTGQWNVAQLRSLLEEVLPENRVIVDYEVIYDFEHLGRRTMLLSARRVQDVERKTERILLAVQDATEQRAVLANIQQARLYAEAIIQAIRDPLLVLAADLRVQFANDAFQRVFKSALSDVQGRSLFEIDSGQWNLPKLRERLEHLIPSNGFFSDFEVAQDFERLGNRTFLLNATTLSSDGGQTRLILLGFQDITEVLAHQVDVRQAASKFKLLFDRSPLAKIVLEASTLRVVDVNDAAVSLHGYSREDLLGLTLQDLQAGAASVLKDGKPTLPEMEITQHRTKPGLVVDVEVRYNEMMLSGKSVRLAVINDITEQKRAERRTRLMMDELSHRNKNLLAVIQAIAARTLTGTRTLAEARNLFEQRIRALARSQSVLIRGGFEGAHVGEIVRLEVEGFSDRVKIEGADVILGPKATQTFALLVHELATNAAKHGALSNENGRVVIGWKVDGDGGQPHFKFHWQEHDGPPVVPPTHEGFGRAMIEKAVERDLSARVNTSYHCDGLVYELDAPLSAVGPTPPFAADAAGPS